MKCETIFTDIELSEIPVEKQEEQRSRYKKKQSDWIKNFYMDGMLGFPGRNPLAELFKEGYEDEITEDDAGQHEIDAENRKIMEEKLRVAREKREEELKEIAKYAKLTRNDICICGSGKKYKKCHLHQIEQMK